MVAKPKDLALWRKTLLRSIKREIREVLGPRPEAIERYYAAYKRLFRVAKYKRCSADWVLQHVPGFPLIYLGDFHTLPRSQTSHLQVLTSILEHWNAPILLMEMFASADQRILDAFLDGTIDEESFLQEIRYQQSWGFRWYHYRDILNLARQHGLRVIGMNLKQNASLEQRDEHFARIVASRLKERDGQPIVVIVGDLHLAPTHLPARVQALDPEAPPSITIYQNSETIYLKEMDRGESDSLEAVDLGQNRYCLFNTPPWVKMESYLNWVQNSEELLSRELGESNGEGLEYDHQVTMLTTHLAGFFGVRPVDPDQLDISVMEDIDFLPPLLNIFQSYPFFHLLQEHRSFYVPGEDIMYLPNLNLNYATAEIVRALLCHHHGYKTRHFYRSGYFFRRVLYLAEGYFATRIINPLYRLEAPEDTQDKLAREGDRRSTRKLKPLRRGNRLAGLYWRFMVHGEGRSPYDSAEANRRDAEQGYRVSMLLGNWTAHRMYEAFTAGNLAADTIRDAFPLPGDRETDSLQTLRSLILR
ncbi:MAG TPA: ChaN family lipoprotein [Thermoanaerobaculia bacterium]|nr:ChaN family lipoprotein [Thermoanaerobaculia bacterium]HUM30410.1 ChaN family lipoprotein [Thermoanaerobaculia bacterium]HXK68579.1 ChaN family lipoprotein [Thermoanaerobaculia bacterium]